MINCSATVFDCCINVESCGGEEPISACGDLFRGRGPGLRFLRSLFCQLTVALMDISCVTCSCNERLLYGVRLCWQALEVEFENGERFIYSAEFLRVESPAADSQRKSARGGTTVMLVFFVSYMLVRVSIISVSLAMNVMNSCQVTSSSGKITSAYFCVEQHWAQGLNIRSGNVQLVAGRRHVAILSVEPIGNYGIR